MDNFVGNALSRTNHAITRYTDVARLAWVALPKYCSQQCKPGLFCIRKLFFQVLRSSLVQVFIADFILIFVKLSSVRRNYGDLDWPCPLSQVGERWQRFPGLFTDAGKTLIIQRSLLYFMHPLPDETPSFLGCPAIEVICYLFRRFEGSWRKFPMKRNIGNNHGLLSSTWHCF